MAILEIEWGKEYETATKICRLSRTNKQTNEFMRFASSTDT